MVAAITNPAINDDARQQFKNPDPPQIAKSATYAKTSWFLSFEWRHSAPSSLPWIWRVSA